MIEGFLLMVNVIAMLTFGYGAIYGLFKQKDKNSFYVFMVLAITYGWNAIYIIS